MSSVPARLPSACPQYYYNVGVNATKQAVFTQRAVFYGFLFENNDSASVYVQLFNKPAASVTVGTTVPDYTFLVPAGTVYGKDAMVYPLAYFDQGMTIAVTTSRSNATNPGTAATVHIWYQLSN